MGFIRYFQLCNREVEALKAAWGNKKRYTNAYSRGKFGCSKHIYICLKIYTVEYGNINITQHVS